MKETSRSARTQAAADLMITEYPHLCRIGGKSERGLPSDILLSAAGGSYRRRHSQQNIRSGGGACRRRIESLTTTGTGILRTKHWIAGSIHGSGGREFSAWEANKRIGRWWAEWSQWTIEDPARSRRSRDSRDYRAPPTLRHSDTGQQPD
jgi:hypothetical protein